MGAEQAGESTSELPAVPGGVVPEEVEDPGAEAPPGPTGIEPVEGADEYGLGQQTVRLTDQPGDPERTVPAVNPVAPGQTAVPTTPIATELPHWTEPPTGQVPAVLSRDS